MLYDMAYMFPDGKFITYVCHYGSFPMDYGFGCIYHPHGHLVWNGAKLALVTRTHRFS